jgi:hypothetical protein
MILLCNQSNDILYEHGYIYIYVNRNATNNNLRSKKDPKFEFSRLFYYFAKKKKSTFGESLKATKSVVMALSNWHNPSYVCVCKKNVVRI